MQHVPRFYRFTTILVLLALVSFALSMSVAHAATYTVTTTNDSGPGSLRQAIADADANPGTDTITFNLSGCPCTIILTSGRLLVNSPMNIVRPGALNLAIDGNNTSRVFQISSFTISISGLTIQNGYAPTGNG